MEIETKESKLLYEPAKINTWKDEAKFFIPNVSYRGQINNYILFERMTPAMTQDALAELYDKEKQKGNPHPTDMPLIWAIVTSAYNLRNKNPKASETLRQFLRRSVYGNFMQSTITLTRIVYNPEGRDQIFHNYHTSDQYIVEEDVVGPDGWLHKISNKKFLDSLLGSQDLFPQINEIYQWINGTAAYIYRLDSKPKEIDERVAGFLGSFNHIDIPPNHEYPAFRVLEVK